MNRTHPVKIPPSTAPAEFLSDRVISLLRCLRSIEGLNKVIDDVPIIDVRLSSSVENAIPLLPNAISIGINAADVGAAERDLEKLEVDQDCIILRNVLQYLPDYRQFVGVAFKKLGVSGFLVIVVPHQFMLERKLTLPSRIDRSHIRYYTPGTLMAEIEEAIDPLEYRVRCLFDNDCDYDYTIDLDRPPSGAGDIVLCLQKIDRPAWWQQLESQDRPVTAKLDRPSPYLDPGPRNSIKNMLIEPDQEATRRILLLKLDHRGDFLLAREAFGLLRNNFPRAEITLLCGEWNKDTAAEIGIFDRILPFNFFPENSSTGVGVLSFSESAAKFKHLVGNSAYDLAIDLRHYEDTRELLRLVNARVTAGLDPDWSREWLTIRLGLPLPTRHGRAHKEFIGASSFFTRIGDHRGFEIGFEHEPHSRKLEHLTWGPYADIGPGNFEFEILIDPVDRASELLFDISCHAGTEVLAGGPLKISPTEFPRIKLNATKALRQFEFRLFSPHDGPLPRFRFKGIKYAREGLTLGVHQEEGMSLLAHLIHMRLRHPFTIGQQ